MNVITRGYGDTSVILRGYGLLNPLYIAVSVDCYMSIPGVAVTQAQPLISLPFGIQISQPSIIIEDD